MELLDFSMVVAGRAWLCSAVTGELGAVAEALCFSVAARVDSEACRAHCTYEEQVGAYKSAYATQVLPCPAPAVANSLTSST